jgi:hypothetical protein
VATQVPVTPAAIFPAVDTPKIRVVISPVVDIPATIPSQAVRTMGLRVPMIPSRQTTPTAMACPRPEIPVVGSPATEILVTTCPTSPVTATSPVMRPVMTTCPALQTLTCPAWMTTSMTNHPPMVVDPANCPAIRAATWATA